MSRIRRCSVRGCSTTSEQSETKLFHFPKFKDQCIAWLTFCDNSSLKKDSNAELHLHKSNERICAIHFEEHCFKTPAKDKIFRGVLPSLHPPLPQQFDCTYMPEELKYSSSNPSTVPSFSPVLPQSSEPYSLPATFPCYSIPSPSKVLCNSSPNPSPLSNQSTVSSPLTFPAKTSCFNQSNFSHSHIDNCSPHKKLVLRYARSQERKTQNLMTTFKILKRALKGKGNVLGEDGEDMVNLIQEKLSPSEINLINAHLKCVKRSRIGKKWTAEEIRLALEIYRRSSKCYSLLCHMFTLPSIRILSSLLNSVPFSTGMNHELFQFISHSLLKLPISGRLCTLMFDEYLVREHLNYNPHTDEIQGFEDYGHLGRSGKFAKYVLVFMVQGVLKKWKQPIATYFSSSRTKADILVLLIDAVIQKCSEAGLHVMCTICSMRMCNIKALRGLGSTMKRPYFFHSGHRVVTLFDPPHLLKCMRNIFISNDILAPVNDGKQIFQERASWNHIKMVYELDKQAELPFLYRLTDMHLNPVGKQKTKVDLAAQIFSYSVAATMFNYIARNEIPKAAHSTATVIKIMDAIFDSCNGDDENAVSGKPLTNSITESSDHLPFWKECISQMKQWRFIMKGIVCDERPIHMSSPQIGWLMTLRGLIILWKSVLMDKQLEKPVFKMSLRRFNLDPLRNLFGAVKKQCQSNRAPTVEQFIVSMKTSINNSLVAKELEYACMPDSTRLSNNSEVFLEDSWNRNSKKCIEKSNINYIHAQCVKMYGNNTETGAVFSCALVIDKVLRMRDCNNCRSAIFSGTCFETVNKGLSEELFTDLNKIFVDSVNDLINTIDHILNDTAHEQHIRKTIFNAVEERFSITWLKNACADHADKMRNDILNVLISPIIAIWINKKNSEFLNSRKDEYSNKVQSCT